MVNEYRTDIYKSAKISIGKVMRNPEILRLVLDHLKNLKNVLKNYLIYQVVFLINVRLNRYVIKLF